MREWKELDKSQCHLNEKIKLYAVAMNLFRAQLADSHSWTGAWEWRQRGVGDTAERRHRIWERFTYECGVTYLWLMPTGQYEMKQISDEVRCIRNDSEMMLVLNKWLSRRSKGVNEYVTSGQGMGMSKWHWTRWDNRCWQYTVWRRRLWVQSDTYYTCLHPSCPHSRCRSRTASGPAHNGCSYIWTGTAHTSSQLYKSQKMLLSVN